MTYGITGLSPLGTYGLGSMGGFGSYDMYMPSSYGMMPSYGNYGGYGMGMADSYMQMMYNPLYMSQMLNQMEELQLQHAGNMHGLMLNNEVRAHEQSDSALIQKLLTNGSVQQGVYNLHQKVVEGDLDGVCEQYDRLKTEVYNTYAKEMKAKGANANPALEANQIIDYLYTSIISAQEGGTQTLEGNIKKYGDGAFKNGFMKGLTLDHHDRDVSSTINHIYGRRIDHKGDKDRINSFGKGLGSITRGVGAGLVGGLTLGGLGRLIGPKCGIAGGIIGAGLAIVGDIIWKHSKD